MRQEMTLNYILQHTFGALWWCLCSFYIPCKHISSEYLSLLLEENAKRAEWQFRSIRDTAEGESSADYAASVTRGLRKVVLGLEDQKVSY